MGDPPSPPRRRRRLESPEPPPPDALAALPLAVLDNILSRLHIYDVVRTSALSRAWRRSWESLPSVDLLRSPGIAASDIDALLLRRAAPVRAFRLAVRDRSWYFDSFYDWLLYLSRCGVRDLSLRFPHFNYTLHSCLFSFRELTSLTLTYCELPPVPSGFAGFPNLKTLYLSKVAVRRHAGKELAALIAASPQLQEATLIFILLREDSADDDEWVIRSCSLRSLKIVGINPEYAYRVEDLPRLEEACLFGFNYAKHLTGMARVTKLNFNCNFILSTEVDVLEQLPFLFENLKSLVLGLNFCKMSNILAIFCLLRSAPALEELDVWGWSCGVQEMEADYEFLNAQWVNHIFAKLHIIRMKKVACLNNEMHFIEFVLSKATVLRVLSLTLCSDSLSSNEEAIIDITEYPRVSPDAQVFFVGREPESANDEYYGFIDSSPENSDEEDTGTSGRGSMKDRNPRRRQRVNGESVAQLEELGDKLLKLQKERAQELEDTEQEIKEMTEEQAIFSRHHESFMSAFKSLSEHCDIGQFSLPPLPEYPSTLASHPGAYIPGDNPVDPAVNSAGNAHADSRDPAPNGAAYAHADSPEDHVANDAADSCAKSPQDHV